MRLSRQILAIAALVACRGAGGQASPQECAPVTTDLPASSTAEGLAGEYQLKLIATSGAKAGAAVEGALTLKSQGEALRYGTRLGGARDTAVVHPLYGSAELNLAAVDAVSVGSTSSMDPMQPGVLVIEYRTASGKEIVIRLGSEANRRDRLRFDGAYMALRVREAGPERILGTWSSGVRLERAAGYFCAVRKADGR